ncbi:MAG: FUN14 domain-containing protein [Planctomycetota bacterium]|jgi:uncharacterized membrane protein (Fun14 family)
MEESRSPRPPPRWRWRLVLILLLIVVASIWARMALTKKHGGGESETQVANQLVQSEPPTSQPESGLGALLPFLTEGALAMLLGIALGMATRSIFKIFVLLFVMAFVGVQILAYKEILTVDWGAFAGWLRDAVLNVSGGDSLGEVVKHKLPSVAALLIGYILGLKRGA